MWNNFFRGKVKGIKREEGGLRTHPPARNLGFGGQGNKD